MIASVKRSINENETFDHRRAKNILAGHEDNLSETALGDPNKDRKRDFSLPPLRNAEVTTIDKIAMHRNQLYMEPYDAFDPAHPLRGKKRFDRNFRPLRTRINLEISTDEGAKTHTVNNKPKVTVE